MSNQKEHRNQKSSEDEIENMIDVVCRSLVDHPESVLIERATGRGFVAFEVFCKPSDVGALIGKRGVHADAMRTLLIAIGTARGLRVNVQFLSHPESES